MAFSTSIAPPELQDDTPLDSPDACYQIGGLGEVYRNGILVTADAIYELPPEIRAKAQCIAAHEDVEDRGRNIPLAQEGPDVPEYSFGLSGDVYHSGKLVTGEALQSLPAYVQTEARRRAAVENAEEQY